MPKGIFITGTDTSVGKTYVCAKLVRALRAAGIDAVAMKPFCCGDREDAHLLMEANGGAVEMGLVNPVWLRVPAAPYTAAMIENRTLDVDTARDAFAQLASRHAFAIIEGVGGWRVPLTDQLCMSDFAAELNLPVVIVAANKLGAINHTQLTIDAVKSTPLRCGGVILNEPSKLEPCPAQITNRAVLEQLLTTPVLGDIPHDIGSLPEALLSALRAHQLVP